jgi:Zn-dependent protease with chaperone function/Zn-finger nucleic acid-binding protein
MPKTTVKTTPKPPRDFYDLQERQKSRSLFLFGFVLLFHFAAIGLLTLALLWSFGLFLGRETLGSPAFWPRFLLFDGAAAALVAFLHFHDARKNGPRFILHRLQAQTPDAADRYHKQFINTVDEIRIAAGLPRVNTYVLPSFAINSLAVMEEDGTPAVAVTEGLLAEGTRDELQAVAAHELAHIARGDASYLTLVCSLANLFEKLREALEPERDDPRDTRSGQGEGGFFPPVFFYLAVILSSLVMHLLSTLVSRERELLADAAAVELCRSPESLARAVYKAHVKNSFVGDFSLSYTPLFIVRPDSRDTSEGLLGRIFSSHPPLMKRIGLLAAMARKKPQALIDAVWENEEARERARGVLHSFEELKESQLELFAEDPACEAASTAASEEVPVWMLAATGGEKWEGPYTTAELIGRPRFSSLMLVKNVQEGVEAKAREFPQLRIAMSRLARKGHLSPGRENRCPRCRIALVDAFYEGVPLKVCRRCRGRLVDMACIDKIIARREVAFSETLVRKAREFEERVRTNPLKKLKIESSRAPGIACPSCGYRMVARPYNYQYFIPVDKCLSCSKIWFDSDELEILQILIESRRK